MTNKVRRAEVSDAPACAKIIDAWIESTDWMPRNVEYDMLTEMLAKGMAIREIYVAGDPVAGYLAYWPEKKLITGFYCSRRGEGVGKALLDYTKKGRSYLQLRTHVPNLRAQAFYRREGFVACEERDADEPGQPRELRMEWHA